MGFGLGDDFAGRTALPVELSVGNRRRYELRFLRCVRIQSPLGGAEPTQIEGPGYHRLDLSLFKNFQVSERYRLEFRSEFFNILNHPNFNYPGFGGNGVVGISGASNFNDSTFGQIGSTRDGAYSSREIQFALKLYF